MRRTCFSGIIMALLLGGCVHGVPVSTDPPPPELSFALEPSESALAQALALFAHGLVQNAMPGTNSQERGMSDYRAALEIVPQAAPVRNALLAELVQRDRPGEALDLLEQLHGRNPADAEVLRELAFLAEQSRDFARAAEAYRKLEALSSDLPENRKTGLRAARVRCLFGAEEDAKVFALLREGSAQPPSEASSSLGLALGWARYFAATEQFQRALPCMEIAIEHPAGDPSARADLLEFKGTILEGLQQPERAAEAYRAALNLDRSRVSSAASLARIEIDSDPAAALNILAGKVRKTPADPIPHGAMAVLLLAEGEALRALEHLRQVHRILKSAGEPASVVFLVLFSNLLIEADMSDEALEVLEDGTAIHPHAHILCNNLAYLWSERGIRLDEAGTLARRALEKAPGNGAYLDTLGWIEYKQGNHHKALDWLMRALRSLPDDPTVLDHAGDVLHSLGRTPEAIAYWVRGLALDPGNPELIKKLRAGGADPDRLRSQSGRDGEDGQTAEPE